MIHFENHAYYLHEKSFAEGYRFVRLEFKDDVTVYKIEWKSLVAVLERLESMPPKFYNPSEGMSPEEMSRYIQFLFEQIQQKDVQHKDLLEQIAGIKSELQQANSEQKRLNALVLSLTNQLNEALHNLQELQRENEDLKASARVSKKHRF